MSSLIAASTAPAVDGATSAVEASPWWGTPVIAGGFLIIGALITFGLNLLGESRRDRRARDAANENAMLETATRLLHVGRLVNNLALRMRHRPADRATALFAKEGYPLVEDFQRHMGTFTLLSPASIDAVFKKYAASTLALHTSLLKRDLVLHLVNHQARAQADFTDALRKRRGLGPLPRDAPIEDWDPETFDEVKETILKHMKNAFGDEFPEDVARDGSAPDDENHTA